MRSEFYKIRYAIPVAEAIFLLETLQRSNICIIYATPNICVEKYNRWIISIILYLQS